MNEKIIQGFKNSYLADGMADNTIDSYSRDIDNFIKNTSCKSLKNVNLQHIDEFKIFMNTKGYSYNTKHRRIIAVKMLVKYMSDYGYISDDFSRSITTPKKPKRIKTNHYMPIEDQERFISHLDNLPINKTNMKHRLMLTLYLATGVRKSELINLKIEDIDFEDNTILINGKGNKQRYVELFPSIQNGLKKYIKDYTDNQSSSYIFGKSNKPLSPSAPNKMLNKRLNECGFEHYRVHDLRHSFASALFENEASITDVQYALGHASVITTQSTYLHVNKETQLRGFAKSPLFNKGV